MTHLKRTRIKCRFRLLAWVVMPEHVHLLIWPLLPQYPVSKVLWNLKRNSARDIIADWKDSSIRLPNQLTDKQGRTRFWLRGGGYDRNIFSPEELNEKIEYINTNPMRRGLVDHPTNWPWSSARWYAGLRENTLKIDPVMAPC